MYYHFNIEDQLRNILSKCKISDFDKQTNSAGELCDITDEEIYKKILASSDGYSFKLFRAFTTSLNTDGVAFSKSSKMTMWPALLPLNEMPLRN